MDVIIHGKPLDASERFSSGIDKELARKIIGEFFAMGSVKEPEALIVDARYWQGSWNSVYTLLLSQTVKDSAGRGSYFAISLIIPQKYCCLISEVYKLLENVVRENVLGVYLNNQLQYIVPNFEDSVAFEKLCSKLESIYHNFEKPFDNSFKPKALNNDEYCSIHDCDSLSVIQLLKDKGRIIVTEKTETKDALVTQSMNYRQKVQEMQGEIQQKNTKINELESHILQMKNAVKQENTSARNKVRELERKISELENRVQQSEIGKQNAESALSGLKKIIAQAVPFLEESQRSHGNSNAGKKGGGKYDSNTQRINRYLPLLNTLLLVLLLGLFVNLKGCSGNTVESGHDLLDSLKSAVTEKEQTIERLQYEKDELQTEFNQCSTDLNKFMDAYEQMQRLSDPKPSASPKPAAKPVSPNKQSKTETKTKPNTSESTTPNP